MTERMDTVFEVEACAVRWIAVAATDACEAAHKKPNAYVSTQTWAVGLTTRANTDPDD